MKHLYKARGLVALTVMAVIVGACGSGGDTSKATAPYSIGYSNAGGVGNGFREEQVCTAKAEGHGAGHGQDLRRSP